MASQPRWLGCPRSRNRTLGWRKPSCGPTPKLDGTLDDPPLVNARSADFRQESSFEGKDTDRKDGKYASSTRDMRFIFASLVITPSHRDIVATEQRRDVSQGLG